MATGDGVRAVCAGRTGNGAMAMTDDYNGPELIRIAKELAARDIEMMRKESITSRASLADFVRCMDEAMALVQTRIRAERGQR